MRPLLAALIVALPAAAAAAPEYGSSKSCLLESRIQEQRIVDDHTILFREGSHWYRNDIPNGCPGMDREKSIRTQTPSAQLCAGDPITIFERVSNFTYGACPLGRFTAIPNPGPTPHPR